MKKPNSSSSELSSIAETGIKGLDHILAGGLPRNHVYLIEGDPGTGKTTTGLQFLLEGVRRGEKGLYVTLSESKAELDAVAQSHGWSLAGIHILELTAPEEMLTPVGDYTMFHPEEVELHDVIKVVTDEIERMKPERVIFDSLSDMRLMARDVLRYRRQILGLKRFFCEKQRSTVLFLEDRSLKRGDDNQLQSLAHGVVTLHQVTMSYGTKRRRLEVVKMRGVNFRGGFHDFNIKRGGVVVYPRLVAAEHHDEIPKGCVSSGIPALDQLLGGGLDRGTSNLIVGAAGWCGT